MGIAQMEMLNKLENLEVPTQNFNRKSELRHHNVREAN